MGRQLETDIIDKIIKIVLKSFEISGVNIEDINCDKFSFDDYEKFIKGLLTDKKMAKFEEHCLTCPACQKGVFHCHQTYSKNIDEDENRFLFNKTVEFFDKIDQLSSKNIFNIIFNVTNDFIDIIKTTGEILSPLTYSTVRGQETNDFKAEPVKILNEIKSPPVSIQVSLYKEEYEKNIMMLISFYNRESDEFISEVEIIWNNNKKKGHLISDKNGEALLKIELPCDLVMNCETAKEQIAQLNVKVEEQYQQNESFIFIR